MDSPLFMIGQFHLLETLPRTTVVCEVAGAQNEDSAFTISIEWCGDIGTACFCRIHGIGEPDSHVEQFHRDISQHERLIAEDASEVATPRPRLSVWISP
jgi:hypothetical protein